MLVHFCKLPCCVVSYTDIDKHTSRVIRVVPLIILSIVKLSSNVLWSNGLSELFFSECIFFQNLYWTCCIQDKYLRL